MFIFLCFVICFYSWVIIKNLAAPKCNATGHRNSTLNVLWGSALTAIVITLCYAGAYFPFNTCVETNIDKTVCSQSFMSIRLEDDGFDINSGISLPGQKCESEFSRQQIRYVHLIEPPEREKIVVYGGKPKSIWAYVFYPVPIMMKWWFNNHGKKCIDLYLGKESAFGIFGPEIPEEYLAK